MLTVQQAFDLAVQHHQAGRLTEAEALYRQVLAAQPSHAVARNNLGILLAGKQQWEEAISAYQSAIEFAPDYAPAHFNLANALRNLGQLERAIAHYRRALELQPGLPQAENNLGVALAEHGELDEAMAAYRRALRQNPGDTRAYDNLIFATLFHPGQDPRRAIEEQQSWNRQFGDPARRFILPHTNDRDPERRLRIAYVSPDLREHVIGRNLAPLFQHHDHRNFEILCYAGVVRPDQLTDEFREAADHWRTTIGVSDADLAEMVREDQVDILVDLGQHMAGNRLTLFARKPAPVQVSFAGYPESVGVEAIEYRISDKWLEGKRGMTKERVFLLESFWCYDPCGVRVDVNELPAKENGRITFGSLNNFCKVNDPLLKLWARVLRQVPDSRLVMLSGIGSHRQRTVEFLEKEGVAARRIEFVERRPRKEYLERYHRLDLVLDTFPYNGHTTSLDALWMGVPVVSLAGERPVSRGGLSQLSNLGLPELVAHSEDEFVGITTRLASDLPRLAELRRTLRTQMEGSVLMDAPRFARDIEAACRAMWRNWCAQAP